MRVGRKTAGRILCFNSLGSSLYPGPCLADPSTEAHPEGLSCPRPINLETAVGSQKSAQPLDEPGKIKKCLITTKVTSTFFISPCTPIAYTAFLRPTAVSRFNRSPCIVPHLPSFVYAKNSSLTPLRIEDRDVPAQVTQGTNYAWDFRYRHPSTRQGQCLPGSL